MTQAVATFGGIDILVNNASAISLTGTLETPMKRFDLMHQINTRGTFLCSQACIPHLKQAREPAHPEPLAAAQHGGALVRAARRLHDGEVRHEHVRARHGRASSRRDGIAVNALWPRTVIATAAVQNLLGGDAIVQGSRKPDIMGDAAHVDPDPPQPRVPPATSSSTTRCCAPPA